MYPKGNPLRPLPYMGGKSPQRPIAKWIKSLLPTERNVLYAEPCAGMCGLLLCRPKAQNELVNDLNRNIWSWWTAVRDMRDEMVYKVDHTPFCSQEFYRALALCNNPDADVPLLDRAIATHVAIVQGIQGNLHPKDNWGRVLAEGTKRVHWNSSWIPLLSERMRDVQIDNRDCLEILDRTKKIKAAVLYVDPPYPGSTGYGVPAPDYAAMTDLLKAQAGRVAVSGYRGNWDALEAAGWQRHETEVLTTLATLKRARRVECLWTNYRACQQMEFGV